MLRLEKVATPLTAVACAVPLNVPADGFVPMAMVIWFVAVVTTLPCASSMLTVIAGAIELPAAALPGCTVIASFAGGATVVVLPEPHPAIKRRETRMEIPINLQVTPAADREEPDIMAILF